jgi:hypothetical protein
MLVVGRTIIEEKQNVYYNSQITSTFHKMDPAVPSKEYLTKHHAMKTYCGVEV